MPNNNHLNLPERIWLQIGPEWTPEDGVQDVEWSQVTHSGHAVYEYDISYTRTDLADKALQQERDLCKATVEHTAELLRETMQREADKDAEVQRLREALRPFAEKTVIEPGGLIVGLERYDFERAKQALAPSLAMAKTEGE